MRKPGDHIRPLGADEASTISGLAWQSKAYWGYSREFMDACRAELTYAPAVISSEPFEFWAYESEGTIVGFYAIERQTEILFELEALFVLPDRIGSGIGRALIEHAKTRVREAGGERLLIQGDPHAERFYRAAGGERRGDRESGSIGGRMLPVFEIDLNPEARR